MDQTVVRETISVVTQHVTEEDKALGAEYNRTMWRALAQANRYLSYGPENARLRIVDSFLKAAARLSAVDSARDVEEARTAYMRIFQGVTTDIPEHSIDALAITTGDDEDE